MDELNNWQKLKIISNTAGIIIIPFVIAIMGNLFAQSIKDREIQGKYVELSLQILKDKPSEDNKNIRQWAIDVVNKYSGVMLTPEAAQDLKNKIPITMNNSTIMNIPISNTNNPIEVDVIFGNANIGAAIISVYDSSHTLITQFKSSMPISRYTLPSLDLKSNKFVYVEITGTSINLNHASREGIVTIKFSQANEIIAQDRLGFMYKDVGGVHSFTTIGKVFIKQ